MYFQAAHLIVDAVTLARLRLAIDAGLCPIRAVEQKL